MLLNPVYITDTAVYFPNEPVANDEMEEYLGYIQFGITVPMDSVQTLNVYQTAFLAEYGRFTAGLVSVETKRGGDKWKWELNDPFPEFRIRSYHLRGLKTATPRLNFEGPIVPGKLYVAEGFEYEIRKTAVYTLPFPRNQKLQEGLNSFTQLDWVVTSKQLPSRC